jgi:hypothetical protein
MIVVVAFVLLIACANVGNLLSPETCLVVDPETCAVVELRCGFSWVFERMK